MRLWYLVLLALLAGLATSRSVSTEESASGEDVRAKRGDSTSVEATESAEEPNVPPTLEAPPTESSKTDTDSSSGEENPSEDNGAYEEELNSEEVNDEFRNYRESSAEASGEQEQRSGTAESKNGREESQEAEEAPAVEDPEIPQEQGTDQESEESVAQEANGETNEKEEKEVETAQNNSQELSSSEEIEEEPEIVDQHAENDEEYDQKLEAAEKREKGSQELSSSEEIEEEPEIEDRSYEESGENDETKQGNGEEVQANAAETAQKEENNSHELSSSEEIEEEPELEDNHSAEVEQMNQQERQEQPEENEPAQSEGETEKEGDKGGQELSSSEEIEEEPELEDNHSAEQEEEPVVEQPEETSDTEPAELSEQPTFDDANQPSEEPETPEEAVETESPAEPLLVGVEQEMAMEGGGALESSSGIKQQVSLVMQQAEDSFKDMVKEEENEKNDGQGGNVLNEKKKRVHDHIMEQAEKAFREMIHGEKREKKRETAINKGSTDNAQQATNDEVDGTFEKVGATEKGAPAVEPEVTSAEEQNEAEVAPDVIPPTRSHTHAEIRAAIVAEAEKAFRQIIQSETKKDVEEELKVEPKVAESEEKQIKKLIGDAIQEKEEALVAKEEKAEEMALVRDMSERGSRKKRSHQTETTPIILPTETSDATGKHEELPTAIEKDTPKAETRRQDQAPEIFKDEFGWTHYPWREFPLKKTRFHHEKNCGCKVLWIKKVYKRPQPKSRLLLVKSTYVNMHRRHRCGPHFRSHKRRLIRHHRSHFPVVIHRRRCRHHSRSLPYWSGRVPAHFDLRSRHKFIHKPVTKHASRVEKLSHFPWKSQTASRHHSRTPYPSSLIHGLRRRTISPKWLAESHSPHAFHLPRRPCLKGKRHHKNLLRHLKREIKAKRRTAGTRWPIGGVRKCTGKSDKEDIDKLIKQLIKSEGDVSKPATNHKWSSW